MMTFRFRIKTQAGGIVNVVIYAKDVFEAQYKLNKAYPGSIMSMA